MSEMIISVKQLEKRYGPAVAVDDLSFDIESGEFFSFLGPSGCGKTTTLRMVAGFEELTSGRIEMNGQDISNVPPHKREVGMVFQNYALFPNKTVGENVGFGLKMEQTPKAERQARTAEYLDLVDLPGFEDRKPTNLSGGQKQRVALARALITEPTILLLDEPLSNLDLKLRKQMRFELKRIQDETDTTFIYVTHDQEEALSMSDRILLMNDGKCSQIGSPEKLYSEPANEFAADFIGDTNLFDAEVIEHHGQSVDVRLDDLSVTLSGVRNNVNADKGDSVALSVRPENITIFNSKVAEGVNGEVIAVTFYGRATSFLIDVNGKQVLVEVTGSESTSKIAVGDEVLLQFAVDSAALLRRRQ